MPTLEALSWGGVDVASWAIRAKDLSGLLAIPARRGENPTVAGRAGRLYQPRKVHDGREFVVEFLVRGATADGRVPADRVSAAVFYDNMHVLAALAVGEPRVMRHTLPDGTVRELVVEVLTPVEPERWLAGMNATVKVAFTSTWAWWRSVDTVTAERTLAAGQTATLTEFAPSDAPIDDAVVTFAAGTSTGNNPRLTQTDPGGAYIGYRRAFTAAERLAVGDYSWNPTGFTFTRTALDTDPRVGTWFVLDPIPGGAPTVRLDLTGAGPMTIRVAARQAYGVG